MKASVPIRGSAPSNPMSLSSEQSSNALFPILIIVFGTITLVILLQLSNALSAIFVTGIPSMLSGILIVPSAETAQRVMVAPSSPKLSMRKLRLP